MVADSEDGGARWAGCRMPLPVPGEEGAGAPGGCRCPGRAPGGAGPPPRPEVVWAGSSPGRGARLFLISGSWHELWKKSLQTGSWKGKGRAEGGERGRGGEGGERGQAGAGRGLGGRWPGWGQGDTRGPLRGVAVPGEGRRGPRGGVSGSPVGPCTLGHACTRVCAQGSEHGACAHPRGDTSTLTGHPRPPGETEAHRQRLWGPEPSVGLPPPVLKLLGVPRPRHLHNRVSASAAGAARSGRGQRGGGSGCPLQQDLAVTAARPTPLWLCPGGTGARLSPVSPPGTPPWPGKRRSGETGSLGDTAGDGACPCAGGIVAALAAGAGLARPGLQAPAPCASDDDECV